MAIFDTPPIDQLAIHAYHKAESQHLIHNPTLTIIDFSRPSNEPRLWIIDMKKNRIEYIGYVAHGINSGYLYAMYFSQILNSHMSQFGDYITDKDGYNGSKGWSLRIHGLDKGWNENIYKRDVVFHPANYVSAAHIKKYGILGRTWGCFGLNSRDSSTIINSIKGGSFVYAYYPNHDWLKSSFYNK